MEYFPNKIRTPKKIKGCRMFCSLVLESVYIVDRSTIMGMIITSDIVAEVLRPRHIRGLLRILGASRVWDHDWGLPRVKRGTVGCNPTSLAARGGIGYIVKGA